MKKILNIKYIPQYVLTYIPYGRKGKQTVTFDKMRGVPCPTPMDILIEAKKNGWTPTNLRPNPECPAIIVISCD